MKLYQALKEKSKLTNELNKTWNKILSNNSYNSINPPKYNSHELFNSQASVIEKLISLKFAINEANKPIQKDIYRLSELKSLISKLNQLSTTDGHVSSYGEPVKYIAQIDEKQKDQMIAEAEAEIEKIQEHIDFYNHTTDI